MRQYRTNGKVERKKIKYGERERERKREKSIERNAQYLSNIIHVRCVGLNTDLRERKRERERQRERKRERKHSLKFYLKIIHLLQAYPNNS